MVRFNESVRTYIFILEKGSGAMRSILSLAVVSLLLFSGCKDDQAAKTAQLAIDSLNQQLEAQKIELMKINENTTGLLAENQRLKDELITKQNAITEAQQQSSDKQKDIDYLTRDYEDLFFLICSEANSHCPGELKYFDPRKIQQGDVILGMKVKTIEVGTREPGSYSISFAETVEVSGKYIVNPDDPMGPDLWLDTATINGQKISIHLGVGGNKVELDKALKGSKEGDIRLKLKNITLQNLPHKPAYNAAIFVGINK
jgi:regulator of replication initiation timing